MQLFSRNFDFFFTRLITFYGKFIMSSNAVILWYRVSNF